MNKFFKGAKTERVCAGNSVKLNSEMCLKRLQSFTFYKWNDAFSYAISKTKSG